MILVNCILNSLLAPVYPGANKLTSLGANKNTNKIIIVETKIKIFTRLEVNSSAWALPLSFFIFEYIGIKVATTPEIIKENIV